MTDTKKAKRQKTSNNSAQAKPPKVRYAQIRMFVRVLLTCSVVLLPSHLISHLNSLNVPRLLQVQAKLLTRS